MKKNKPAKAFSDIVQSLLDTIGYHGDKPDNYVKSYWFCAGKYAIKYVLSAHDWFIANQTTKGMPLPAVFADRCKKEFFSHHNGIAKVLYSDVKASIFDAMDGRHVTLPKKIKNVLNHVSGFETFTQYAEGYFYRAGGERSADDEYRSEFVRAYYRALKGDVNRKPTERNQRPHKSRFDAIQAKLVESRESRALTTLRKPTTKKAHTKQEIDAFVRANQKGDFHESVQEKKEN